MPPAFLRRHFVFKRKCVSGKGGDIVYFWDYTHPEAEKTLEPVDLLQPLERLQPREEMSPAQGAELDEGKDSGLPVEVECYLPNSWLSPNI